jgi:hypothetical protein
MDILETSQNLIQDLLVDDVRLFVGRNSDYYLNKWKGSKDPSKSAGWNWAAFFAGVFWFGYRKMYVELFCCFGVFILIDLIQIFLNIDINSAITYIVNALMGILGNTVYFHYVKRKIKKINEDETLFENKKTFTERAGGVSWAGVGLATLCTIGYLVIIFVFY